MKYIFYSCNNQIIWIFYSTVHIKISKNMILHFLYTSRNLLKILKKLLHKNPSKLSFMSPIGLVYHTLLQTHLRLAFYNFVYINLMKVYPHETYESLYYSQSSFANSIYFLCETLIKKYRKFSFL